MPVVIGSQPILTREDLERAGGAFTVSIVIDNPEVLNLWLSMGDEFVKRAETVFLRYAFQVHKYLIRLSPADTGRLRGGWTALLEKYNQPYARQLFDTSLYDPIKAENKTPYSQDYHWDTTAIEEGRGMSSVQETPFNITLQNDVPYGEHQEFGTSLIQGKHFVELAKYKAELWFPVIFDKWFSKISKEGKIVDFAESDDESEITN